MSEQHLTLKYVSTRDAKDMRQKLKSETVFGMKESDILEKVQSAVKDFLARKMEEQFTSTTVPPYKENVPIGKLIITFTFCDE